MQLLCQQLIQQLLLLGTQAGTTRRRSGKMRPALIQQWQYLQAQKIAIEARVLVTVVFNPTELMLLGIGFQLLPGTAQQWT